MDSEEWGEMEDRLADIDIDEEEWEAMKKERP